MNRNEQAVSGGGLDETIGRIEDFYRRIAGADAPSGDVPYAPIPAEKDPVAHVEEQLDRLYAMLSPAPSGAAAAWMPPVSVAESDAEVVVSVDLPGVSRDAVSVTAQGNAIVVSGTRPAPRENGSRIVVNERVAGAFRRVILVPEARTSDPVAHMRDGVLEIRVPRERPLAKPRTVAVN